MPTSVSMTLTGGDVLGRNLKKLSGAALYATQKKALRLAAEPVVKRAQALCPVDTGELRDSIKLESVTKDWATIVATAEHAPYVEYGTSRMPAQPFLRPAVDTSESVVEGKVKAVIASWINTVRG